MNWKKFLKPDWRKIILSIIIFLLGFLPRIYFPLHQLSWVLLGITWWPVYVAQLSGLLKGLYLKPPIFDPIALLIFIVAILITPIFWYFLSCLIVWIHDKVKKKK